MSTRKTKPKDDEKQRVFSPIKTDLVERLTREADTRTDSHTDMNTLTPSGKKRRAA